VEVPAQDRAHDLPDGRSIAWCEYGVPEGVPVLYFHGIPGSRLDGRVTADAITAAGLRLIALERPGFGKSSPVPGKRTYAGWANDVVDLAEALGIERFAIVAYSAGAPYALATAISLGDRVTSLQIVSGVAPSEMPDYRKSVCPTDKTMTFLGLRAPWLASLLVGRALKQAKRDPERFGKSVDRDFPAAADQELLDSGFRPLMPDFFLVAGSQGPAGIVEDFAVWARPSGLTLGDVKTRVHLWHGEEDRTVSVSHSRWIASQLKSAELTVWPGVGHLHTPERWAEVYASLS
jgi:pimeloyl-ACP methyl ester carboxylesterase